MECLHVCEVIHWKRGEVVLWPFGFSGSPTLAYLGGRGLDAVEGAPAHGTRERRPPFVKKLTRSCALWDSEVIVAVIVT